MIVHLPGSVKYRQDLVLEEEKPLPATSAREKVIEREFPTRAQDHVNRENFQEKKRTSPGVEPGEGFPQTPD